MSAFMEVRSMSGCILPSEVLWGVLSISHIMFSFWLLSERNECNNETHYTLLLIWRICQTQRSTTITLCFKCARLQSLINYTCMFWDFSVCLFFLDCRRKGLWRKAHAGTGRSCTRHTEKPQMIFKSGTFLLRGNSKSLHAAVWPKCRSFACKPHTHIPAPTSCARQRMYHWLIAPFIPRILLINLHNDSDDSDIC